MNKLDIKHLAPYLPYGLKIISTEDYETYGIETVIGIRDDESLDTNIDNIDFGLLKPILRPLSDLTKEIEHNGKKFVPVEHYEIGDDDSGYHIDFGNGNVGLINDLEFCAKHNDWHDLQFVPAIVQKQLIKWHFDVFGLIEQGLAININKIKK